MNTYGPILLVITGVVIWDILKSLFRGMWKVFLAKKKKQYEIDAEKPREKARIVERARKAVWEAKAERKIKAMDQIWEAQKEWLIKIWKEPGFASDLVAQGLKEVMLHAAKKELDEKEQGLSSGRLFDRTWDLRAEDR